MKITPISPIGIKQGGSVSFGMNYTEPTKRLITKFIVTDRKSDFFSNQDMLARQVKIVMDIPSPKHSDSPMSIKKSSMKHVYEFSLDNFRQNYVLLSNTGMCYQKIQANIVKFVECFDKFAGNQHNLSRTASMDKEEFRILSSGK